MVNHIDFFKRYFNLQCFHVHALTNNILFNNIFYIIRCLNWWIIWPKPFFSETEIYSFHSFILCRLFSSLHIHSWGQYPYLRLIYYRYLPVTKVHISNFPTQIFLLSATPDVHTSSGYSLLYFELVRQCLIHLLYLQPSSSYFVLYVVTGWLKKKKSIRLPEVEMSFFSLVFLFPSHFRAQVLSPQISLKSLLFPFTLHASPLHWNQWTPASLPSYPVPF